MSTGIEPSEIVDPWLYSTFSGDLELTNIVGKRITNGGALGPQATPWLTWDMNSSRDITTANGGHTLWNESLFEIKIVGQGGSYSVVLPAAKRVHALIGKATNLQTPNGVITCRRDRVIRYVELDDNVQFRHLGGIYRVTAHSGS